MKTIGIGIICATTESGAQQNAEAFGFNRSPADMVDAAEKSGVINMTGFNYVQRRPCC